MNTQERAIFLDAITDAVNLLKLTQAAVQRARSQCHAEIYEHVDLMAKRVYEMKITSEWLQQGVLGKFPMHGLVEDDGRLGPDRRQAMDPRVASMRKQLLSADSGSMNASVTPIPVRTLRQASAPRAEPLAGHSSAAARQASGRA